MRPGWIARALALATLAGCTKPTYDTLTEAGPVAAKLECNPLAAEWDCLYPYPSDFFTRPDATAVTGKRIEFPGAALPHWVSPGDEQLPIDVNVARPADGFSNTAQIGVRIPGSVQASDLIPMYGDLARSLDVAKSTTLLLDAETGEPVLHFSETDPRPEEVDDRILLVRPMLRLKGAHRYVVVLRGLHHVDGSEIQAPAGFAAVRDDDADGATLERIAGYYEAHVFPVLAKAGIDRASVQLAWDFTTMSDAWATGDMLEIRRQLLAAYAAEPPKVTITAVTEGAQVKESPDHVGRDVRATVRVPLFLETAEIDLSAGAPPPRLHRDASGKPIAHGFVEIPFAVRIPKSVLSGEKQGRLVQYGHGFFGSLQEMIDPYPSRFADQTGSVLIGTDWMGMAAPDRALLVNAMVAAPNDTAGLIERVHQGMANFMSLTFAAKGPMLAQKEFQDADGKPLYDPAHAYYYGLSLGSILGKTYVTLSPHVVKAALASGGASFGFLMSRASPFDPLLLILETVVQTHANGTRMELLMQTMFDRVDPATYVPHLLNNPYESSPADRRVLLQVGISDSEVPSFSEHMTARTIGLPYMTPANRAIYGLQGQDGPIDGSAIVEWDFGVNPPPDVEGKPAVGANGVHESLRRQATSNEMIDRFFRPGGRIENTCGGGACKGTFQGG